jgi:chemotaxis protein CheX
MLISGTPLGAELMDTGIDSGIDSGSETDPGTDIGHAPIIDAAALESILGDVLLSLGVTAWEGEIPETTSITTTGAVTVSGTWNGAILVELPEQMDVIISAAMFQLPIDEIGRSEIDDAVGELANMVGGSVKSLMPEPSRLSLPTVVTGQALRLTVPGAALAERVTRETPDGMVIVSVWSGPHTP